MYLYEIWVNARSYQGRGPLTYSHKDKLPSGTIVEVAVRNTRCLGVVRKMVNSKLPRILPVTNVFGYRLPATSLALLEWIVQYYPGPTGPTVGLFLHSKVTDRSDKNIAPGVYTTPIQLPPLTTAQQRIIKHIENLDGPQTILLHGDTGSGKTRIYIELARESLASNKSVIILTPEIGLVPQLANEFGSQFPEQIITFHSDMAPAKRQLAWQKILTSKVPLVVIGPRSALFAPLSQIGLIVVDEAHEKAYKQEQTPHYQTSRVAARLAQICKANCVLGSATPLIADYYALAQKENPILRLDQPARVNTKTASVSVVDLTDRNNRKTGLISKQLLESLETTLKNGGQSLLFLNRRGSARVVLCQQCGWSATCPNCDIGLVYHGDSGSLRCHTCGFTQPVVIACPVCKSPDVMYQSPGAKALETELGKFFPQANIKRFDSDNKTNEKLEKHYQDIVAGKVDIIVGTQMIAKGLDIPKLSLVGIIDAETSLQIPDFSASEQTFQLLTQVMGRVGRTKLPSNIILQTYHPKSALLSAVIKKNWRLFYDQQIAERQQFGFPPFNYLLQLTISRASRSRAQMDAKKLSAEISERFPDVKIRGFSPSFHEKVNNSYRWQIVIMSKRRNSLLDVVNNLPSGWRYNLDPNTLL